MTDAEPPARSLLDRLGAAGRARLAALRARPAEAVPAGEWRLAAGLAALIAAGPLATLVGAELLAAHVRAEVREMRRQRPLMFEVDAATQDRITLHHLLNRPTLGATLEALARALPAEAVLARVEYSADNRLEADIAAPDPDTLRAALRREPALARLRETAQRRGDGTMLVSFRDSP